MDEKIINSYSATFMNQALGNDTEGRHNQIAVELMLFTVERYVTIQSRIARYNRKIMQVVYMLKLSKNTKEGEKKNSNGSLNSVMQELS